jgi:site-specific recombinase XerD
MITDHLRWMRQRNYAESYIAYRAGVLRLLAAHTDPVSATWQQIEKLVLERQIADATKNLHWVHLEQFYGWAVKYGWCTANPVSGVDRLDVPENLPRPIAEHDLQKALVNADGPMRVWILLGGWAGMRCMEIAHLRGEHVGRDIRSIRIVDSKHGKSRVVPMHQRISDALPDVTVGRLWIVTPNVVSQKMSRHFKNLGIDATAHMLRHRFATQLYEQTGDINLVRDVLGHKSSATTQVYARLADPKRRAAIDGLA